MSTVGSPETSSRSVALYQPKRNVLGLVIKYLILGMVTAIGTYAVFILAAQDNLAAAGLLAIGLVGINALYLTQRAVPAKYLLPGTIAMIVFSLLPIIYTVFIAFTNYSTGHVASKPDAIERITADGYEDIQDYLLRIARDESGQTVYLLATLDLDSGLVSGSFVGTPEGLEPLPEPLVLNPDTFQVEPPPGFTALSDADAEAFASNAYRIELEDSRYIVVDTSQTAWERRPQFIYDSGRDIVTDVLTNAEYVDNGEGSFVGVDPATGEQVELQPGWQEQVGFKNFERIINDPLIRGPFGRVFVWTVIYALSSVLLTFSLGLAVALLFNVPKMAGRRIYRAILVIPYAIPGFLSLLVWRGLLNQQWGLINDLLGAEIPWLEEPTIAKISILLVNTWLGFPYFFLVATGALQAIPSELKEAAAVDGAGRFQVFRSITLPLLLVATGPLLVASFAYNFNNFNQIFLLTGGGPALADERSVAGATDILISYTYKIAFAAGKGNDYAMAAAISIVIFFIVGAISFWSFRRSKALENMS